MDIRTTTELHPLPNGEVTLLGAVDRVTGAMTRVDMGDARLLVDCGRPIGPAGADWTLPSATLDCDAVILTHGHTDHVSALPQLLAAGWTGPIVGTRATLALARLNGREGIELEGGSQREIHAFVSAFDDAANDVRYDRPDEAVGLVPAFDGRIALREAGHIIGSASVELRDGSQRVVLSGDLGRPDSPILRDFNTSWDVDAPVDLVVMESTYGDREHPRDSAAIDDALEAAIEQALRDGGHILVPAFSIGRTQTLLYHLNTLVEAGRIRDLPVAVDTPMGLKVTELYQHNRELFDPEATRRIAEGDDPLEFENLYSVRRHRDSIRLRDVPEPMLIIAGSGMCTGGRIVGHLIELLPVPETCVLFVGYQAYGTPGRAIQEAAARRGTVTLRGQEIPVRCEVQTLGGLSAHADRTELARWLDAIPGVERVALHHGEPDAQRGFAEWFDHFVTTSS